MDTRYYVAMAATVDSYEQSDYLYLIQTEGGTIIGYAAEFDICTTDIADACVIEKSHCAQWFAWDDQWKWRAATLDEIQASNLGKYLIGSKKDMKISTPIEAL